jgi:hypothetical protein
MNSCTVISWVSLLLILLTVMFIWSGLVMSSNSNHKNTIKYPRRSCGIPFRMGRSKCFDCDTQLSNEYCNQRDGDSYLSRLEEVAKPTPKLGPS